MRIEQWSDVHNKVIELRLEQYTEECFALSEMRLFSPTASPLKRTAIPA